MIHRQDGFLYSPDIGVTPSIGIESDRLAECLVAAQERELKGVFGSSVWGFAGSDLDFLSELPDLIQVWFWDVALRSVEGLYSLTELRYCGINPKRSGIDFSRFQVLETLVVHWNSRDTGLFDSPVREFYLWHYNPKHRTFTGLELPAKMKMLEVNWTNVESLAGLPVLRNLSELGIHRSKTIRDLSLLPEIVPNLKKLIITACGKVDVSRGIREHPTLELAIVNGERICG